MEEKPSKWLIALFFGLGTMLNIPLLLFGGVFRLGAIPIFIGAYFAAKGVQHLRNKRKINKAFPGNPPYSRDALDPSIRKMLESLGGDKDDLYEYTTMYAKDLLIHPAWKWHIIRDFAGETVNEENKQ